VRIHSWCTSFCLLIRISYGGSDLPIKPSLQCVTVCHMSHVCDILLELVTACSDTAFRASHCPTE